MDLNLGNRIAPPRFVAYAIALVALAAWSATQLHGGPKDPDKALAWFLAGFDVATFAFLASLVPMFRTHDPKAIALHAARNDANRGVLLAITLAISAVVLGALTLMVTGGAGYLTPILSKALVIATLALSWLFANTVYALHYTHLYYAAGKTKGSHVGGLDIPSTKEPDYRDFLHFALILGMTFQTADIDITSRAIRRISTGHCLAAFVFNIGILSFSINMIAGN